MNSCSGAAWLYSGAGNTFFIVNHQDSNEIEARIRPLMTKEFCLENTNSAVDGMVFLSKKDNLWQWDFYNSDGSPAEMCGNAARCVMAYLKDHMNLTAADLITKAGVVSLALEGKLFSVKMPVVNEKPVEKSLMIVDQKIGGWFVNTGVPHFVITDSNIDLRNLEIDKSKSSNIRFHRDFGVAGTNVTYIEILNSNRIKAVTYERGVEDFTKACGTGAVAAALVLAELELERAKIKPEEVYVEMPGGELIVIPSLPRPTLTGPALFVERKNLRSNS
jgi:diaminopimelate epimerase